MKRPFWFRSIFLAFAALLLLYTATTIAAIWLRPGTQGLFADGLRSVMGQDVQSTLAAFAVWEGSLRSEHAVHQADQAFTAAEAERPALNAAAQGAAQSALRTAPINPSLWLVLGQLKSQVGESAVGPLKMSYFTGVLPPDAMAVRLHTAVTTTAIDDEDIRLFAQSDVRAILTHHLQLKTSLAASYRSATPTGRRFLLATIELIDPKFGSILLQHP